jgi:hypothetical protein
METRTRILMFILVLVAAVVVAVLSLIKTTVSAVGLMNTSYSGIVYILPSGNSTPLWAKTYGDRVFFLCLRQLDAV